MTEKDMSLHLVTREAQVINVFGKLMDGMCLQEACDTLGISKRTYERYAKDVIPVLRGVVSEQRDAVASQVVGAYPKVVDQILKYAVGENIKPKDRKAFIDLYLELHDKVVTEVSPPDDTDAEDYLAKKPAWLQGPETVIVQVGDAKVTVRSKKHDLIDVTPIEVSEVVDVAEEQCYSGSACIL